ncbi:MAG: DNA-binding protein WhiA [Bacilli bacterium]|jgi:cell division protein WhiA
MDNPISFTQQIKEELTNLPFNETKDRSVLSAFIRSSGSVVISHNQTKLVLKTENNKVAKYIYVLLKTIFPMAELSFSYRCMMQFYKSTQYLININTNVEDILSSLKIDFLDSKIPYDLTDKELKIKGYLEGLFLYNGTCSNPKSSNYHLEMYTSDEAFTDAILKLIHKIKDLEFDFKTIKRRSNYIVYLKKSDQISDFLAYLEANDCCLLFENVRVNRDFANVSNRLINMDTYNLKKTLKISNEQIEDIKQIDKSLGLKNISNEKLRELCYLRLENKDLTYKELAALLSKKLNKEVSKSNVNHLFIKIKDMAKGYRHEY